jgi:hypothetical protein
MPGERPLLDDGKALKDIAHVMLNIDADELILAGIMNAGSDWHRWNHEPLIFVVKLTDDKATKLVNLILSKL